MKKDTSKQILDVAEAEMRKGGLDAISFRDIATAIGIKSASVHYHFPHKEDLGTAVTARYRRTFLEMLGDPNALGETTRQRVRRLTQGYRRAFEDESTTCLCLTLGAEIKSLPVPVAAEVRRFYSDVLAWLTDALAPAGDAAERGEAILASLAGAMILSLGTNDPTFLQRAEKRLLETV